jgi:hypothetical protein
MGAHVGIFVPSALLWLVAAAVPAIAQEEPAVPVHVLSPASRVRCLDEQARLLVQEAVAVSATVAGQVTALQSTDLIVGIETNPARTKLRGEARLMGATPSVRHVRIRITIPAARRDLIAVLGHELQHALEFAAAPEVRDAATMRAYLLRIGYERVDGGYYETKAAQEAGRRVAAEVSSSRGAARATAK